MLSVGDIVQPGSIGASYGMGSYTVIPGTTPASAGASIPADPLAQTGGTAPGSVMPASAGELPSFGAVPAAPTSAAPDAMPAMPTAAPGAGPMPSPSTGVPGLDGQMPSAGDGTPVAPTLPGAPTANPFDAASGSSADAGGPGTITGILGELGEG